MIVTRAIIFIIIFSACSYSQTGWVQQTSGTTNQLRNIYMVNANTGFISGAYIVLKTTNGGNNWSAVGGIPTSWDYYDIQRVNSSTGFLAGFFKPATLHKTTNGGVNWSVVTYPPVGYPRSVHFFDHITGFILTHKTTNGGMAWVSNYPSSYSVQKVFYLDENTGWGCFNNKVIKTTNSGGNWTEYLISGSHSLQNIFFADSLSGWCSGHDKLYQTTNGGVNWSIVFNVSSCSLPALMFVNNLTGWAAGCQGRVYKTTSGGTNWQQQPANVTSTINDLYFLNEFTGWAVGEGGLILKTTSGGITSVIPVGNDIPKHYILEQNYPNPFNPSTKIKFQIPVTQFTSLAIYDMLGREIAVLAGEKLIPGTYETEWDASDHPSGVYFYKLLSGGFSKTMKMVLLK